MTITVRSKTELVVPRSIRRRAGFKTGDKLEFKVSGGVIHIIPKLPSADDEYTPEQRRAVDAEVGKGLEDIKKGRLHGPFDTHEAMIEFLHDQVKKGPRKTNTFGLDDAVSDLSRNLFVRSKASVEKSLDAARTSARATPATDALS